MWFARKTKVLLFPLALTMATSAFADTSNNLQHALDAAKKMEWALEGDKAFLLIKRGLVRSEVGLIFGYADNERACEEIAIALSRSGTAGEFECDAVQ